MDGTGLTSAPAEQRAAELTRMLADPDIACVVPPWGGETAIDLVDLLDWDALADAEPDVARRLLRPVDGPRARHHPAGLGDHPRRQPRGHAVRRPRRPAALARPGRRAGAVRAARLRPGGRLGALRAGRARHRVDARRPRAAGRWRAAAAGRHRPADRRLRRDDRQPRRHAVRRRARRGPRTSTSPRSSTSRRARRTRSTSAATCTPCGWPAGSTGRWRCWSAAPTRPTTRT